MCCAMSDYCLYINMCVCVCLCMRVFISPDQADQGTLLIRATLQSLLSLSWHVRGKYPLLMSFAQHTPVASMLTMLPSLATDVLAMIGDMKLHSPVSLARVFVS